MDYFWFLLIPSLFFLDRFLLWCERSGWIFYRKRKSRGGNTAIMSMTEFLSPGVEQTAVYLENERKVRVEINDAEKEPGSKDSQ